MALYGSKRHYTAPDVNWNKAKVKKTIRTITSDVIALAESDSKWPTHKLDGSSQIKSALALIAGFHLLTDAQVKRISKRVMETTINTADQNERHANWWPRLTSDKTKKNALVHVCHGAPGLIITLAGLPTGLNKDFDNILLKGGELIWDAGLLEKGPNLCHGTSGNGYAFLKLYERTGDELWMNRARSYAMYAIEQYEEIKSHYKQTRLPLWTGDAGLAVYLWNCLHETTDFPTLDVF